MNADEQRCDGWSLFRPQWIRGMGQDLCARKLGCHEDGRSKECPPQITKDRIWTGDAVGSEEAEGFLFYADACHRILPKDIPLLIRVMFDDIHRLDRVR